MEADSRKSTILIVADTADYTESLRGLIQRLGVQPLFIGQAELGPVLEFLDPPPELILVDASASTRQRSGDAGRSFLDLASAAAQTGGQGAC